MNRTQPTWRRLAPLFLAMALVATLPFLLERMRQHRTTQTAPQASSSSAPAPVSIETAPGEVELGREAAAANPPPAAVDPRTFAMLVDELVAIGQRTAALAQQDDHAGATASDQEARALFAILMERFDDAGERALDLGSSLPSAPAEGGVPDDAAAAEAHLGHRLVLHLVLAAECTRRETTAAAGARERKDGLVRAILDVLPVSAATVEIGSRTLIDQPHLRATHEPQVLGLLRLASEGAFPRSVATHLLVTLWNNVQRFGERTSDDLARLALLWLGGDDPSQRTAACRQLLLDPRYRDLVVSWLRERGDRDVAAEIAGIAAQELPPDNALALLRELTPLLPSAPNAYLVLGFRAPEALADAYRALLASDVQPRMRADLVTGVGMTTTALGLEIAQLALQNDPSPDVRLQAVFALTARRDPVLGEAALQQALDDPRIANDPLRLSAVVLALQNLETTGDVNALHRIGQRLQAMALGDASRQTLAGILARGLPTSVAGVGRGETGDPAQGEPAQGSR